MKERNRRGWSCTLNMIMRQHLNFNVVPMNGLKMGFGYLYYVFGGGGRGAQRFSSKAMTRQKSTRHKLLTQHIRVFDGRDAEHNTAG